MSNYTENALEEGNQNTAWAQVVNLVKDNWTLLDVGCSSGNLGAELIKKKSCTVDGIEIDAKDAELARKKLRQVEILNIETSDRLAELFEEKYDAILLIDVIEHLVEPAKALKKLQALLKPGGSIIFSIPNMAHISVRLALLEGDFSYTETGLLDKTHLHFYDFNEVTRIFEAADMGITKINYPQIRYPDTLIKEKLNKLGLKPSEKFFQQLDKPEYYAYQFIGEAKHSIRKETRGQKLKEKQAIQNDFTILSDEIEKRKSYERKIEKELRDSRKETESTNETLQSVLGSRSYKLARKIARVANYMRFRK